jgi:hypothetical protein
VLFLMRRIASQQSSEMTTAAWRIPALQTCAPVAMLIGLGGIAVAVEIADLPV